jgi:hypothetical protein
MAIIPLSRKQYELEIKPLADQIVRGQKFDVYYEFFVSEFLPCRRLLHMPDPWLPEEVVLALEITLNKISPEGFYLERSGLTYTGLNGFEASLRTSHFEISSNQFRHVMNEAGIVKEFTYGKVIDEVTLEGWTVYSKKADWVIYIDPCHFLMLAGKPEVIQIFDLSFSIDYMTQIRSFLAYFKTYFKDCLENWRPLSLNLQGLENWLVRLMIHVFGEIQGIELLKEFDFFANDADN